ncbi:E3 ubiquitin-protein ligase TTC3 [Mytilus galloprovincialis]|uniref:E3 ubiquitin-protein ligase TTC3 n=2 Tax=Mytilus galloprovincialis TaxID=29158 RepID=A0A8B6BGL0_MYTGA|nr:E3 ubiquitin-protein ligase TTC3 [Mytilus galloprovincialis]
MLVKTSASLEKLEAKMEFDAENTLLKEQNESEMSVKPITGEVNTVNHEIKLSTLKTDNDISTVKNDGIASTVENSGNAVKRENLDKAIAQNTDIKGSLEDIDDDELDFDVEMSKSYHSVSSEYVSAASQQTSQCHTPVLLSASEENQFFIANKNSSQESVEKQSELLTDNDSTSTMNSSSAQQETSAIIDSSHKNNEQFTEGESKVPYLNTNVIGVSTSSNATIPQEESAISSPCQRYLESNVQPDLSCQNQSGLLSQVTNNSLYEAVVQQLKQVYPHLASNPVMLNMIALQQTSVLHNYLGKSDGAGLANQMQAFGTETAGTANATNALEMAGETMPSQIHRTDMPNTITNQTNILPTNLNFSSQAEHSKSDAAIGNHNKPMKSSLTSSDHNLPIKTSVASSNYDLSMKSIVNMSGDQSLPMKPIAPSENNMKTMLQGDGSEILKKPADISIYGNKSPSNVNNCNSLELKMDKYLCSPEKITMVTKSSKSLSSSIIDDSTLSPKSTVRPPGFGGKNDFSVESSSDTAPASGSQMVNPPNSSNFNGCTENVRDFKKTEISPNRANILSGFNKESTIQKPLEVTGSGFTFSKTLSYNLPQSKTAESATSNVALEQGKKVPLLPAPEKKPPLLALPVMEKTRHLSQPNSGRKDIFHGKLSGFDSNSPSPTEAEKKWQFSSGLPNLPPRLQKKRRSFENTKVNHPPVLSEPSWDDEVDDYAEPFVPNFDPRRPLESHIGKQSVDTLEEITLPEKRKTEDVKVDGEKEKQEEDEDWCQVTKKKRKETKPSDVKKPAASRIRHKSAADKTTKSNNFDRLVQMLMEVYTGLTRNQVMDVIQEVRVVRGGLSGLTVKEIMEIARTVIIKKYEHKMTNNQRPMQASDVKGKSSTMTGRRKAELQNIATGHPSNQVTMETVEERAHRIKVYNAMKAKQALHTSEKLIDDEDDICVICHDELSYGETKMLDCKHEFHTECISKWVYERERTCPTCRGHALFEDDFPKLGT